MYVRRRGLGALPIGYNVGDGPSTPCDDLVYASLNPACGGGSSSSSPEVRTEYLTRTEYVQAAPRTMEWNPLLDNLTPFEAPKLEEAAASSPTVVTISGGAGGGWRNPYTSPAPAPAAAVVELEEEPEEGPGFGIVEAALAAGLAWVLARSSFLNIARW